MVSLEWLQGHIKMSTTSHQIKPGRHTSPDSHAASAPTTMTTHMPKVLPICSCTWLQLVSHSDFA